MTGTRNPFITAAKTSILAGFALLFVLGGSARGAEVHLAWDANSESDLAGYVIHYGTESGKYSVSHDVGNVTDYRVNNLTEGQTYYFAATAYDSSQNHSSYSQELTYQIPTTDTDGDGLSDGSETDVYQTDPTNPDTDGDGLSDGAEVSSHGTDPTAADSDGDGLDDRTEIEIFFSDPLKADTDGDGLNDGTEAEVHGTDPTVADSDKDGLWDGAEIQTYNTDPLDSDSDQDGYTDGYEVSNGMDPTTHQENRSPHQPLLAAPADGTQDVELTPTLETEAFSDPDAGDYHRQTQWQVSAESDFSMPVFDLTSDRYLTGLQLPEALLDTGRTYYWRVRFFDRVLEPSPWSNARWFATVSVSATDLNQNGIPDSQEVDSTSDLDGDQTPDIQQVNMKTVRVVTGDERIAIKGSPNVTAIETLISISDGTIAEQYAKPASMPLGMICFRFHVAQYGDTATIDIFFSDPAPEDSQWYGLFGACRIQSQPQETDPGVDRRRHRRRGRRRQRCDPRSVRSGVGYAQCRNRWPGRPTAGGFWRMLHRRSRKTRIFGAGAASALPLRLRGLRQRRCDGGAGTDFPGSAPKGGTLRRGSRRTAMAAVYRHPRRLLRRSLFDL